MAVPRGWVYFISGEGTGRVKIGWTKHHPSRRLGQLQAGSPAMLSLLAVIGARPSMETLLHRMFADIRTHGEWFMATRPLLDWIGENASPWPDAEEVAEERWARLRLRVERELRRELAARKQAGRETATARQKRQWWETQGRPGPAPLDRIIWGANGWVLLKEGHAEEDYWRFIDTFARFEAERLRFELAGL